eukprot:118133_1
MSAFKWKYHSKETDQLIALREDEQMTIENAFQSKQSSIQVSGGVCTFSARSRFMIDDADCAHQFQFRNNTITQLWRVQVKSNIYEYVYNNNQNNNTQPQQNQPNENGNNNTSMQQQINHAQQINQHMQQHNQAQTDQLNKMKQHFQQFQINQQQHFQQ